jgi:hypothetical protein
MTPQVTPKTVLVVGPGVLGGLLTDMLASSGLPLRIVLAGRDGARVEERANLARFSALNQGRVPHLETCIIDVTDTPATVASLDALAPDMVVNASSLYSYWRSAAILGDLPAGLWLPLHLSTALGLMQAVRRTRRRPLVVNAAYPDAVNPALGGVDLAPDVGIGNVMNVVPALRVAAALLLELDVGVVDVRLVAHHAVSNRLPAHGDTGGAPYHLTVYAGGDDVTTKLDIRALFGLLPTRLKRIRGRAGMTVTAGSAFAVVRALTLDTPACVHAPGPLGLIGGYPVRASAAGVELDLPATCSRDEAIAVNEAGQRFEGIEAIHPDGRVVFTESAFHALRTRLGAARRELHPEDSQQWALELRDRCETYRSTR